MPNIAQRIGNIQPSAIVQMSNRVAQMKAQGINVISLSIGVPNFTPPQHVFDAAKADIDHGSLAYLPGRGTDVLVKAFLHRLKEDGFEGYSAENVAVTLGAKNALFDLFYILVEPGDEVVIPTPCWTSYLDWVDMMNGVAVPLRCSAKQNYKLTPQQLEAAITPKTKLVMFNNPSNPTGMVYSQAEIAALAQVLVRHDVWIISDDIYDKLIFDGAGFYHLVNAQPELKNRTIMLQSISKNYGLPGWRVGMATGPKVVIDKILTLTANTIMNVPGPMMAAAAAAFSGPHDFMDEVRNTFAGKRDMVMSVLGQIKGVVCPKPQGAFYAFPDVSAFFGKKYHGQVMATDEDIVNAILEHKHVALMSGRAFGEPNSVRISYACDDKSLQEGLKRVADFFAELEA